MMPRAASCSCRPIRDDLTGLMNRRHFMESATSELRRAQRYSRPTAVALRAATSISSKASTTPTVTAPVTPYCAPSPQCSRRVCASPISSAATAGRSSPSCSQRAPSNRRASLSSVFANAGPQEIRLPDGLQVRVTLSIGLADASHCPIDIALQRADPHFTRPSGWGAIGRRRGRGRLRLSVDDPVGGLDDVEVVLDDDDGVAVVARACSTASSILDVLEVQAGGRFVEDVQVRPVSRLRQFERQLDPLRLAADSVVALWPSVM